MDSTQPPSAPAGRTPRDRGRAHVMKAWLAFGYENGFATRFQITCSQDSVDLDDYQVCATSQVSRMEKPF
ncbi:hypothetical protein N7519_010648 [Penicillium mononematosum]|uniref:uncharacterized protein n=1 Tax=Penicillium mononematosum TaxID=268346 RepID=UPI002548EEED|nr:uncharacterized protein N7519_010648 [Penicillium mononematosum]KAJ6180187.1 hypothetical protein N7519_010648 [Penicillium mononematosum]